MPNLISRAFDSLYQVFKGLSTVGGHTFKEPITEQYPDHAPNLPAEFRGRLALSVNPETGEHLCISCRQCERVCPDKCIEITAHKSPETNKLELIDFKSTMGSACSADCALKSAQPLASSIQMILKWLTIPVNH